MVVMFLVCFLVLQFLPVWLQVAELGGAVMVAPCVKCRQQQYVKLRIISQLSVLTAGLRGGGSSDGGSCTQGVQFDNRCR